MNNIDKVNACKDTNQLISVYTAIFTANGDTIENIEDNKKRLKKHFNKAYKGNLAKCKVYCISILRHVAHSSYFVD